MVDITGHLASGLPFALPAWYVREDRTSVAFVALAAVAALLPDVDLVWDDAGWIDSRLFTGWVTLHVLAAYLTTPTARRHPL